MSIMDMFRNLGGNNNPPATATPAGAAGNPTVPNMNANKSDGSMPAIPAAPTTKEQSPLAGFANLWETKADGSGNTPPSLVPTLNLDPTKLSQQVAQIDFMKGINQDLLTKAMTGNDPASVLQVINAAVQNAFQHGITVQAGMVKSAFEQQAGTLLTHTLPETLKDYATKTAVVNSSPIMANPAVAPIVDIIRQRFQAANPTAQPAEVQASVQAYFDGLSQEVLKASGFTVQQANNMNSQQQPKQQDWSTWVPGQLQ